jgi:hypothetical protein
VKELLADIETAYTVGAVWGYFEQNVASVLEDEYILGIGYSFRHEKTVHWKGLPDFPLYKTDPKNDHDLIVFIADLIDGVDTVIAHNGRAFDMKKIRARMLYHGLQPLNEPRIVDTKVEVKKKFNFISNKLDELSRQLLGERKVKHSGIDLWTRCQSEKYDAGAWKEMGTYCKQDVVLLGKLYDLIRPWMDNPPNWNLHGERPPCCPACGYPVFYKHGLRRNMTTTQQKYKCLRKGCGHIFGGRSVRTNYRAELEKQAVEETSTQSGRRTKSRARQTRH